MMGGSRESWERMVGMLSLCGPWTSSVRTSDIWERVRIAKSCPLCPAVSLAASEAWGMEDGRRVYEHPRCNEPPRRARGLRAQDRCSTRGRSTSLAAPGGAHDWQIFLLKRPEI